ncbi:sodium/calcium exchanger NCL-like [Bidens hawaiensis]|uniref:sodium/calcium exchanger NCL-like n=1 Tax=Bidens hawaiensis TaxID=980011 RepID=UPI004049C5FB
MACVRGLGLTFIVLLMIVGMMKGRWLELEPYSTSSMISDGIDHEMNLRTGVSDYSVPTTTLYGEKRCESIYGFLPCADTMAEGVFLMIMYTYLMMLGEEWTRKGGEVVFELLGVAGVVSTESAAQDQVVFGVSMYAGSTLITLTFIWGLCIILNRDRLRGKEPKQAYENRQDSSTKCLPLRHKLSILNDNGVNIDEMTGEIAVIMLLSLIPFATVELLTLINSPVTILLTLTVSGVSLILNPLIQVRSLAYLKEEYLQIRFLSNVQRLAKDDLCDQHGNPNFKVFERC